jgi:hypothetical protein
MKAINFQDDEDRGMRASAACGPHCLELSYTEVRDGRLRTVLGCSVCGKTEEYSVSLKMYPEVNNLR